MLISVQAVTGGIRCVPKLNIRTGAGAGLEPFPIWK